MRSHIFGHPHPSSETPPPPKCRDLNVGGVFACDHAGLVINRFCLCSPVCGVEGVQTSGAGGTGLGQAGRRGWPCQTAETAPEP